MPGVVAFVLGLGLRQLAAFVRVYECSENMRNVIYQRYALLVKWFFGDW
jgi:hypothetical protein